MTKQEYINALRSAPVGVLASLLGLSERRVRELGAEHGWRVDRGRFDAVKAVADYLELRASREPDLDLAKERALLAKKQREKIDFDIAQRKRELIPAAWVERPWNTMIGTMRSRLLQLPTKLPPLLQATDGSFAQMRETIRKELYSCMTELSEFSVKICEPKDS